ncbi:MAG TPA: sensor histidine kinase, partial [Planctomycetota bacterium]|nr:sensor histidine kinase [Planctomycetota bacterium]
NPAAADALAPDLEQLFAPFWRADKSRADPVHAGLGLTLARVYARLLGLDITLRYAGGVFTARLGPFRDAGAG